MRSHADGSRVSLCTQEPAKIAQSRSLGVGHRQRSGGLASDAVQIRKRAGRGSGWKLRGRPVKQANSQTGFPTKAEAPRSLSGPLSLSASLTYSISTVASANTSRSTLFRVFCDRAARLALSARARQSAARWRSMAMSWSLSWLSSRSFRLSSRRCSSSAFRSRYSCSLGRRRAPTSTGRKSPSAGAVDHLQPGAGQLLYLHRRADGQPGDPRRRSRRGRETGALPQTRAS